MEVCQHARHERRAPCVCGSRTWRWGPRGARGRQWGRRRRLSHANHGCRVRRGSVRGGRGRPPKVQSAKRISLQFAKLAPTEFATALCEATTYAEPRGVLVIFGILATALFDAAALFAALAAIPCRICTHVRCAAPAAEKATRLTTALTMLALFPLFAAKLVMMARSTTATWCAALLASFATVRPVPALLTLDLNSVLQVVEPRGDCLFDLAKESAKLLER